MANKKRIRLDKSPLFPIPDWCHADEHVRRVADMQSNISDAENDAKKQIDKIKADLAKRGKGWQETLKLRVRSLEAFAASHKDDFKKQKSRKLNFGVLGWRKSISIKITKNTLGLIKQIFTYGKAAAYIHTKESVDKEALAKLTDEQLAGIKARRDEKDVFFVEPSSTKAADYNE